MNKSLDISDYTLDDILKLFRIEPNCINEDNMKKAKKITLMTHPDKSGKSPDIFIFFSKAYNILNEVYKLSIRKTRVKDQEYEDVLPSEVINKLLATDNFNALFNEMWNKASSANETTGHGKWLSSDSDFYGNDDKSADKIRNDIRGRQLAVRTEPEAMCNSFGTELDGSQSAQTGKYEDIRKAYTETIVGVTNDDYNSKRKYNNVDELVRDRAANIDIGNDHEVKLERQKYKSGEDDTRIIYEMVKQDENNKRFIDTAISHVMRLCN